MPWKKSIVIGIVIAALVICLFYQQRNRHVMIDSGQHIHLGTFCQVVVVAPNHKTAQQCVDLAFEQIQTLDAIFSNHRDDSELAKVNAQAFERPVKVSDPLYTVVERAVDVSQRSDGAFDITVGPLIDLWKQASDANSIPNPEQIREAKSKVGYQKLLLDPSAKTIQFETEGMKLDLGGIAKGYIIDACIEAIQRGGGVGAMVNIGGDIRCFGRPKGPTPYWRIGLQNPSKLDSGDPEGIMMVLSLENDAVATSGHYRRFFWIDGQKVSHIVEPESGKGSDKVLSTTIIAHRAILADALATTVTVMGTDKGLGFIETLPDVQGAIIPGNQESIRYTEGFEKYIWSNKGQKQQ